MNTSFSGLQPYPISLAGSLLAAREAVIAPIRPILREANVTEQQWRVLRVLAASQFLDAKGIAERALLYAATVTRILKELDERQLIERHIDPADGRRWIVSITGSGKQLVNSTARHVQMLIANYAVAFTPERLEMFRAEALALAEALKEFRADE